MNRLAQGIQVAQAAQITQVAASLEEARLTMGALMNRLLREQAGPHAETPAEINGRQT